VQDKARKATAAARRKRISIPLNRPVEQYSNPARRKEPAFLWLIPAFQIASSTKAGAVPANAQSKPPIAGRSPPVAPI
jgi:hypothetical protein